MPYQLHNLNRWIKEFSLELRHCQFWGRFLPLVLKVSTGIYSVLIRLWWKIWIINPFDTRWLTSLTLNISELALPQARHQWPKTQLTFKVQVETPTHQSLILTSLFSLSTADLPVRQKSSPPTSSQEDRRHQHCQHDYRCMLTNSQCHPVPGACTMLDIHQTLSKGISYLGSNFSSGYKVNFFAKT